MEQNTFITPSRARILSSAEHAAFSRHCRKTRGTERLFLLYLLIRYTGLRISEALSLTVADVWDGYEVARVLSAKTSKQRGQKRKRNLSLSSPKDVLRIELKRHVKALGKLVNPTDYPLFATSTGRSWERTCCTHVLYDVAQAAGIRRFSWHDLRHSYGQAVLDHTGSMETVQATLGHSSIAVTSKYIHPKVDALHEVNVAIK